MAEKSDDPIFVPQQQVRNPVGPSVSHIKPYYLWRMASEETELTKVLILRHNCKALCGGISPNSGIRLAVKPNIIDTDGAGKRCLKSGNEPMAKVLVKEQFHAVEPGAN